MEEAMVLETLSSLTLRNGHPGTNGPTERVRLLKDAWSHQEDGVKALQGRIAQLFDGAEDEHTADKFADQILYGLHSVVDVLSSVSDDLQNAIGSAEAPNFDETEVCTDLHYAARDLKDSLDLLARCRQCIADPARDDLAESWGPALDRTDQFIADCSTHLAAMSRTAFNALGSHELAPSAESEILKYGAHLDTHGKLCSPDCATRSTLRTQIYGEPLADGPMSTADRKYFSGDFFDEDSAEIDQEGTNCDDVMTDLTHDSAPASHTASPAGKEDSEMMDIE